MGKLLRLKPVAVALLLGFLLTSCYKTPRDLFRGRGHKKKQVSAASPPLKVATREELYAIIARTYDGIESFQATNVNLTASQGSLTTGITDYAAQPGIILFRRINGKDNIRVQAKARFVGTLLFDMVSDSTNFRFLLPSKSTLFFGLNSAPANSPSKMENLRPDAFLSSMFIRPFDPAIEVPMLKDDTNEEDALYRLELNRTSPDGTLVPGREVWFDREDLSIVKQKVYTPQGDIISDTDYSKWQMYNGVPFPAHIDINRRIDGYGVAIEILEMVMNKEIAADKFELPESETEGATLKEIQ
jgi:hypothetical protein